MSSGNSDSESVSKCEFETTSESDKESIRGCYNNESEYSQEEIDRMKEKNGSVSEKQGSKENDTRLGNTTWCTCKNCKLAAAALLFSLAADFFQTFSWLLRENDIWEAIQKQPSIEVLIKRCSENMQQICRRINLPKCDFNKVALQLYYLEKTFTFYGSSCSIRTLIRLTSRHSQKC